MHLYVDEGQILDVGFEGDGCAISIASASMMTETIKGLSVPEASQLFERIHSMLTDEASLIDKASLGKLSVMAGVREFPMRVKCATLVWHTMEAALKGKSQATTE